MLCITSDHALDQQKLYWHTCTCNSVFVFCPKYNWLLISALLINSVCNGMSINYTYYCTYMHVCIVTNMLMYMSLHYHIRLWGHVRIWVSRQWQCTAMQTHKQWVIYDVNILWTHSYTWEIDKATLILMSRQIIKSLRILIFLMSMVLNPLFHYSYMCVWLMRL